MTSTADTTNYNPATVLQINLLGQSNVTLRDAINAANNSTAGASEIVLGTGAVYQLTATDNTTSGANAMPEITSGTTIVGNGTTIEAMNGTPLRLFYVGSSGSLTLNDLHLSGGQAADGGAIDNAGGTVALVNDTLSGNSATTSGGAIYNDAGGTVTLTSDTLSGNWATTSGGAFSTTPAPR